jgi:outer membrane protein OmpA-like peptidoglycan-associated protein
MLPTKLGAEFLTYVLWAVSPEGRAINLGGIPVTDSERGRLKATTQLQSFSLFVTAEPYSAVRQPSEMLILENVARKSTRGKILAVNDYKLMKRSQYEKLGNPLALTLDLKKVPLELYEARNAVEIAKSRKSERYAAGIFLKAEGALKTAENDLARKANRKDIVSAARQAAQFAEDARALSVAKQEQERVETQRLAAAENATAVAESKAAAEAAEARKKTDDEARHQAELAAAREAQLKAETEAREAKANAAADIAAAQAKAVAARARAAVDESKAREAAARADAERARRAAEELRARLLEQFNRVLETRDSPRGLVITMADVLFDTGQYALRPEARECLARLSGIVASHPGLYLQVEGHTDSTGGDEFNQKLSEQRAQTVRLYLMQQGLNADMISAAGFGKTMPIADNDTVAGRQKNRRVELIVSGDVIDVRIGK